jgi:hypothetical protein
MRHLDRAASKQEQSLPTWAAVRIYETAAQSREYDLQGVAL